MTRRIRPRRKPVPPPTLDADLELDDVAPPLPPTVVSAPKPAAPRRRS
jgi:hypothetical protein